MGSTLAAKGTTPPDFTATTLNCHSFTLSSTIRGHGALINFFASWCTPCKDEAPDMEALYREHQSNGFTIIAVDTQDTAGDPTPFYSNYGYTFPGVWDDGNKISHQYLADRSLPVLVWVKCDGTVYDLHIGQTDRATMESNEKALC